MFDNKNHVGRPSNEELQRRKNKKLFAVAIVAVAVIGVGGLFSLGAFDNLMGNSVTNCVGQKGTNCSGKRKTYQIGDANMDGKINVNDVTTIQRYITEYQSFNEIQKVLADVNKDEKVNITDVTILQKYLTQRNRGTIGAENYIVTKINVISSFSEKYN